VKKLQIDLKGNFIISVFQFTLV